MSSSNNPITLPISKSISSNNQIPAPSLPSGVSNLLAAERQRRGNWSSGSPPAVKNSNTTSTPRSNQSQRKQNKSSRRPKLTEEMSDAAAIRTSGRKGQTNITHLMNFTLPPRPYNHSHHGHVGRGLSYSNRRNTYSWGYNAADKARYIHANYRFIVNPQGDYSNLVSVDDHVDWKDVLQVLVSSKSQSTNCPICLSTPISPRMAKCGHIFCLPCLIRYMHSTDDATPMPEKKVRWKKCPICEDSIYISEARPVRWYAGQEGEPPREGGDVVLRLMKRDYDGALALPKEAVDPTTNTFKNDIPWYFAAEVMDYARIMKGSTDYMQSQYDQEIAEIELQEKEDELMFGEETQWTQKAIASIKDAKEKARIIGNHPNGPSPRSEQKKPMINNDDVSHVSRSSYSTEVDLGDTTRFSRSESLSSTEAHNIGRSVTSTNKSYQQGFQNHQGNASSATTFFFYQTLLHYYLSPLDIRILRAEFEDFSLFPSAVLARVEHVSTGHTVDDDLRKRAKYLGHLPQGCEVGFLECDWTDIVSPEILKRFSSDLERRRKRNKDKEMREEKERVRAEKEEDDKRLASIRRRRDSISRVDPAGSSIGIPGSSRSTNLLDLGSSASPPWSQPRAGFTSLASPSTSPNGRRTVWGTTIVAPSDSPILTANLPAEPQEDGWLQNWEHDLMREDELLAQMQSISLTEPTASAPLGKKKKQKKITLMSTNGRRAA